MKQITIQIPDQNMSDILTKIALASYKDTVTVIVKGQPTQEPNPQSPDEYAQSFIVSQIQQVLANLYSNWLIQGARQKAMEEAKAQFVVQIV